jgi:hypothetical protein
MEVGITEQGTFELLWDKWDMMISLLALGFGIALVVVVVTASVRLGWRFWPWILLAGVIAWLIV